MLEVRAQGRRPRGRPRVKWIDYLNIIPKERCGSKIGERTFDENFVHLQRKIENIRINKNEVNQIHQMKKIIFKMLRYIFRMYLILVLNYLTLKF